MKKAGIWVLLFAFLLSACSTGGNADTGNPVQASAEPTAREIRYAEDGRIILTIGAFQTDSSIAAGGDLPSYTQLKKAVDRFNGKNEAYQIEIRSYGDAAGADAMYALNSEILGGDMPDMLMTYGMPKESYARKGLLLDLYSWYERDQFFSGPVRSMETEGKLYAVSPSIQLVSFIGLESVLGRTAGYSLEDIYGAWEWFHTGENAFIPYFNAEYTFLVLAGMRMAEWVDAASGACRFDSPEFLSLLEFCRKLPAEAVVTQSEAYAEGRYTYDQINALCVKNEDALLGLLYIQGEVGSVLGQYAGQVTPLDGEPIVHVGIPGTVPAAAGCIGELPIAVSARCADQEGAKQFLDSLWDLRYRAVHEGDMRSIPLVRSILEEYIRFYKEHSSQTFTDENGREYSAIVFSGITSPFRDADIDAFLALIESAGVPVPPAFSSKVDPILAEEALAFFAGTQSAEKTAKNIQTRYSVYLEEQK